MASDYGLLSMGLWATSRYSGLSFRLLDLPGTINCIIPNHDLLGPPSRAEGHANIQEMTVERLYGPYNILGLQLDMVYGPILWCLWSLRNFPSLRSDVARARHRHPQQVAALQDFLQDACKTSHRVCRVDGRAVLGDLPDPQSERERGFLKWEFLLRSHGSWSVTTNGPH